MALINGSVRNRCNVSIPKSLRSNFLVACAVALCSSLGVARGETMTSGPGYVQYSGNIDFTLQPGGLNPTDHVNYDDSAPPDGMYVPLSQFDSSLGTLTQVTLHGQIDLTYSYSLANTNSTQSWDYKYSYDIELDAPYVSPASSWVQAVDTETGTVLANGSYSTGTVAVNPFNDAVLTSSAALAAFTGPGTVSFNILDATGGVDDSGTSGNGIENWSMSWTGDVSVRYDYTTANTVPLPAGVWSGGVLLGLMAVNRGRRRLISG
jgi:hypothetical protein